MFKIGATQVETFLDAVAATSGGNVTLKSCGQYAKVCNKQKSDEQKGSPFGDKGDVTQSE